MCIDKALYVSSNLLHIAVYDILTFSMYIHIVQLIRHSSKQGSKWKKKQMEEQVNYYCLF